MCTYVPGLFGSSHMNYDPDPTAWEKRDQPDLEEMTEKAIQILKKNSKGFFLLVEGDLHSLTTCTR